MDVSRLSAVDVHAHFGAWTNEGQHPVIREFLSSGPDVVARRAAQARTQLTAVSAVLSLCPRDPDDVLDGNEQTRNAIRQHTGLLGWAVVDPRYSRTFEQADELLRQPRFVGIKIHPYQHDYDITEYGRAVFEFAAEHDAVVLSHTGDERSWPERFVPLADEYPQVKLILAHLGNGGHAAGDPTLQVKALESCRHGNLFTDTSSARSLLPGLIEWAVSRVGAERVLYGTDSPLYFAPSQRTRIDQADLSAAQKQRILRDNAVELLRLSERGLMASNRVFA